ncbi:TonB-dependent receptor [Mucilaginibacter sp. RS28]|uniref:TonB-dependent receptor n=1 Tax=Mucilaginibacter straminoryzae TaxID=2932774 RepID=A0A9X1X331_9SPHI|nr:TonB-dependent receptor [Mucilaginibacter straminoryzae]MCJ8209736.1 TonB-dependent receptor [Mucilaginibacter straminoryzae]
MKIFLYSLKNKPFWLIAWLTIGFPLFTLAQTIKVEGVIKDVQGPLPGVSITVKGTTSGTKTNASGAYSLSAPANAVLVYTSVGYKAQTINLSERKPASGNVFNIDLVLETDATSLNDVVVVGFGQQKKVNLTAAVSTINAKDLADRPVQNVTQALEGLVPGLNISQNSGSLESSPSINIRGIGSISGFASDAPLVLIDGMEGDLNALNPQDVESVSVLKDAAASSIYGSRAAFGVILVTTKKGKVGAIRVNYNNSFRGTTPVIRPKEMDSYTFALYFNDASLNGGSSAFFDTNWLKRIKDFQDGKITTTIIPNPNNPQYWADGYGYGNDNVDWYKAIYKKRSFAQEHNLSLSGGTDKTTYYISGDYLDQTGLMRFNPDGYNRYGVTGKINNKINKYLDFNYSMRFIREELQRPSFMTDGLYNDLARQGWPTLPLYDPNGFLYSSPSPALGLAQGGQDRTTKDWNYHQLQLVLEPIKGWRTFGEVNYRIRNDFRHYDVQQLYNHDVAGNAYLYSNTSSVYEYAYKQNYFNSNIYSEYSKSYKKNNFKGLVGYQTEITKYRDLSGARAGIIVADLPVLNLTSGLDPNGKVVSPSVSGQYQQWSTVGFFGRLNYDYDGKYLLEGNIRRDASSRFRENKRWGWFPSVSAGWNIAREGFWNSLEKTVNTLKFRGSYGNLGNQNTYDWYPTYSTIPYGAANGSWLVNGQQPSTASAPSLISTSLTWETIRSYDAGLDFGMFNNRLTGTFDWFIRKTLNMVGPAQALPATLGTGVPPTNNTDLKSVGYELEVAWNDRMKNGLGYRVKFLLSDAQTTVTRYPNPNGSLNQYRAGQKLGEIWGFTTLGIAKTQAEMDQHLATLSNGQSVLGSQWAAGDIMYADYNHDGKLDYGASTASNPGDQHIIGNSTPRYRVGFDVSMDFKGFDFRAFFQGILKRDYWTDSYLFWGATDNIWWSSGLVQHADYFRNDPNSPLGLNLNSYYPRPTFGTGKNHAVQTRYLQNAAYLRLKNLQIGYTIPASITKRIAISKLRFFASGENLVTWTKLAKMFDPEMLDYNWVGNPYPLSKVVSFGLSATL